MFLQKETGDDAEESGEKNEEERREGSYRSTARQRYRETADGEAQEGSGESPPLLVRHQCHK